VKVGVLGSGDVGKVLVAGFVKRGHQVMIGTRDSEKLGEWLAQNPPAKTGSLAEAAGFAEVVVLAVKGTAALDAVWAAGAANLAGKTVIDATNPIADAPPVNGVLTFFTEQNESLMERLQGALPEVHFVKAFNSVGNPLMIHPQFPGGIKPTMFICGNDEAAKQTVRGILDQFGWETADMGQVEAARAIEALCKLWLIPGFTRNEWNHALKLLRPN
jgi:predicted dinucleotide-binding enzyme